MSLMCVQMTYPEAPVIAHNQVTGGKPRNLNHYCFNHSSVSELTCQHSNNYSLFHPSHSARYPHHSLAAFLSRRPVRRDTHAGRLWDQQSQKHPPYSWEGNGWSLASSSSTQRTLGPRLQTT